MKSRAGCVEASAFAFLDCCRLSVGSLLVFRASGRVCLVEAQFGKFEPWSTFLRARACSGRVSVLVLSSTFASPRKKHFGHATRSLILTGLVRSVICFALDAKANISNFRCPCYSSTTSAPRVRISSSDSSDFQPASSSSRSAKSPVHMSSSEFTCRLDTRSLHMFSHVRRARSTPTARSIQPCSASDLQWPISNGSRTVDPRIP